MVSVLVWPLVVIVLGIVFRRALVAGFQTLTAGLRSFKAAGVELAFAMDNAWQDVTEVLAGMPGQATKPGEVPTNLVDLYPLAAKNPRRAVREAFRHVRQALAVRFPATGGVSQEKLTDAMDGMVAHDVMSAEVEQAVGQVSRVLAMMDQIGDPDQARRQAFEYIGLAESAIHVILRGTGAAARPASGGPDIAGRWTGSYVSSKGPMDIQLVVEEVRGGKIACPKLEWREHASHGSHAGGLDLGGVYRAVVLGDRMIGDWRKGTRLVGMLQLTRTT